MFSLKKLKETCRAIQAIPDVGFSDLDPKVQKEACVELCVAIAIVAAWFISVFTIIT